MSAHVEMTQAEVERAAEVEATAQPLRITFHQTGDDELVVRATGAGHLLARVRQVRATAQRRGRRLAAEFKAEVAAKSEAHAQLARREEQLAILRQRQDEAREAVAKAQAGAAKAVEAGRSDLGKFAADERDAEATVASLARHIEAVEKYLHQDRHAADMVIYHAENSRAEEGKAERVEERARLRAELAADVERLLERVAELEDGQLVELAHDAELKAYLAGVHYAGVHYPGTP